MVQRYSINKGVVQSDAVTDRAKRKMLENTRLCYDDILSSVPFATAIKEAQVFLMLRKINNRTVTADIDQLIEVLRTFGAAPSYDKLAELCFSQYQGTLLTMTDFATIHIQVRLNASLAPIYTQDGDAIATQKGDGIAAVVRGAEQERNDYEFLVKYLAPNPRKITFEYTEA